MTGGGGVGEDLKHFLSIENKFVHEYFKYTEFTVVHGALQ